MFSINMLSKADSIKGQGVLSAYNEQVKLVKSELNDYNIYENKLKFCNIMHFHTINLEYYFLLLFAKHSVTVSYVHFLPETLEGSIHLPRFMKEVFYKYVISFYKNSDKLVVVNPYFIKVLEGYGIKRDNITYIPNFVSNDRFYKVNDKIKEQIRYEYNIDKDKFVVLGVGQLQKRKGVVDFIKIAKKLPDVEFIWAGDAVFGKMSEGYDEIKKIMDSNLPSNVHFLGLIEREKMNDIYNIANVMFLPSYEELFPMSILEAMCLNLPILIRDLDIYKDILFDFYIGGNNNDEFTNEIRNLKDDIEYYNKACENSKKGNKFYSKENVSHMWKLFYDKLRVGDDFEKR